VAAAVGSATVVLLVAGLAVADGVTGRLLHGRLVSIGRLQFLFAGLHINGL
jgi:hypothetical protein